METAVQQRTRPMCPVVATDRHFPSLQLPPTRQEPGKETPWAPRLLWQCEAQVMKATFPSIILANAEVPAAGACPPHLLSSQHVFGKAPTLGFVTVLTFHLHSYPQVTKLHLPLFADEGAKSQRGYITSLELHSSTEQN